MVFLPLKNLIKLIKIEFSFLFIDALHFYDNKLLKKNGKSI